jgi:hypothetical protein
VQFTRLPKYPQYVGKRLDEAAKGEGRSEVGFFIRIVEDDRGGMKADLRSSIRRPSSIVRPSSSRACARAASIACS